MVNGGGASNGGVEHGALLVAFVEAVMGTDENALADARAALRAALKPAQLVDTAALIALFNIVTRIADSTGIVVDSTMNDMIGDIPSELNLTRFRSSANTLAVR